MASESSDRGNDTTQAAADNLERVRRNVIRTIVDEVKKEIDSSERPALHAKADKHTKHDYYVKGLPFQQ
jgi:hypothetical protein